MHWEARKLGPSRVCRKEPREGWEAQSSWGRSQMDSKLWTPIPQSTMTFLGWEWGSSDLMLPFPTV